MASEEMKGSVDGVGFTPRERKELNFRGGKSIFYPTDKNILGGGGVGSWIIKNESCFRK